jgi:hypothetical protein
MKLLFFIVVIFLSKGLNSKEITNTEITAGTGKSIVWEMFNESQELTIEPFVAMLNNPVNLFLSHISKQSVNKKHFVITGKIVPENAGMGQGTIEITKDCLETSNMNISENGSFKVELEFDNEYSLTFKYPGHFNKIIIVSTDIPQEVGTRNIDFPPLPIVVQLLKVFKEVDTSFTLKPCGKIFYSKDIDNFQIENYIIDIEFIEKIEKAKPSATQ